MKVSHIRNGSWYINPLAMVAIITQAGVYGEHMLNQNQIVFDWLIAHNMFHFTGAVYS